MAAMGLAIAGGYAPEHPIVLSALILDLYREQHRKPGSKRIDLLGELRAHGFARGDTEHMRLILEAFENLASPTRRTRRLMRRPYFPDARLFFEMTAPSRFTRLIQSPPICRDRNLPQTANAAADAAAEDHATAASAIARPQRRLKMPIVGTHHRDPQNPTVTTRFIASPDLHLSWSEDFLPLLVRGEVGAIPIAPGEVQRQHTATLIPALRQ
jgi:hypothetical protein